MNTINQLEPKEVFKYFQILSDIPRGSGHEEKVSNWFVNFAKEHGLEWKQDEYFNVLIKKPGSAGYEDAEPIILHGHMDMVCKKKTDVEHDFLNEGLDLYIENGYIRAKGTTLGADNGIGIAYFLALLDDDTLPHPPLEIALTVMEEMGKVGGNALKGEWLSAKRMIDLNWHKDDHLLTGCGGDVSVKYTVPIIYEEKKQGTIAYSIDLMGLRGGHCEFDIVLDRGNAIKLIGRIIRNLLEEIDVQLAWISGGVQNNVIPSESRAVVIIDVQNQKSFLEILEKTYEELKNEYAVTDPDIQLKVEKAQWNGKVFSAETTEIVAKSIMLIPNGVMSMSFKIPGISECSNNIGLMTMENDCVAIISTITSGVTTRKHEVMKDICSLAQLVKHGVTAKQFGTDAPEWEYNPNSKLLAVTKKAYLELFGEEAQEEVMPASLELGLFREKVGGVLDIISIGTETHGVHTPDEELKIDSVAKTWKLFKEVLKRLK